MEVLVPNQRRADYVGRSLHQAVPTKTGKHKIYLLQGGFPRLTVAQLREGARLVREAAGAIEIDGVDLSLLQVRVRGRGRGRVRVRVRDRVRVRV